MTDNQPNDESQRLGMEAEHWALHQLPEREVNYVHVRTAWLTNEEVLADAIRRRMPYASAIAERRAWCTLYFLGAEDAAAALLARFERADLSERARILACFCAARDVLPAPDARLGAIVPALARSLDVADANLRPLLVSALASIAPDELVSRKSSLLADASTEIRATVESLLAARGIADGVLDRERDWAADLLLLESYAKAGDAAVRKQAAEVAAAVLARQLDTASATSFDIERTMMTIVRGGGLPREKILLAGILERPTASEDLRAKAEMRLSELERVSSIR